MPANPKHLTTSKWQRFAKISAGILGGYFVSITFHMALCYWFNHVNIVVTSTFTGFILWTILLVIAFLAKNGWKIWGVYILISLILSAIIYTHKLYFPI